LTCFPLDADSRGDFETGEAGGIEPVKVWFGYAAPIFRNVFLLLLVNILATKPSTVAHSLRCAAASLAGIIRSTANERGAFQPGQPQTEGARHTDSGP